MADINLEKEKEIFKRQNETNEGTGNVQKPDAGKTPVSETWAEETIADLDDFIESQGIYIRQ